MADDFQAAGQYKGVHTMPVFHIGNVPVNAVTLKGIAPKGALLVDSLNGNLYQNTGTIGSPTWTQIS